MPEPPLYPKPVPLNDTGHPDGAARIHNLPDEVKPVPPEEPPALPVSVALPAVISTPVSTASSPAHTHGVTYAGFLTLAVGVGLLIASEYYKSDHDALFSTALTLIMAAVGLTTVGKSPAIK